MFNYYFRIIKRFLKLEVVPKKYFVRQLLANLFSIIAMFFIPFMASRIINSVDNGDFHLAYINVFLFFMIAVAYIILHHYKYWIFFHTSVQIHDNLQRKIMRKIANFDEKFTDNISVAAVINSSFADVTKLMNVTNYFAEIISYTLGIIAIFIVITIVNLQVGFFIITISLIIMALFTFHMQKRNNHDMNVRNHQEKISTLYNQIIEGHQEVHSFNLKPDLHEYLDHDLSLWDRAFFKRNLHQNIANNVIPVLFVFGRFIIYSIIAAQILSGITSIATLVLIIGYYETIVNNFDKIMNNIYEFSRCSVSVERLYNLFNYKTPHMIKFGKNDTDQISGKIEFRNVNFTYNKKSFIKDLSFTLEPNTFTIFVGDSGAGKSTVFRLLLRLYKPSRGKILLDDVNINDYTKEVFASNVSIVNEKPFIFDMTIRENLNLIDDNEEEQIQACKLAGIHNDIMRMPKQYDTVLVGDAINLSAGQKQQLALARMLLSRSEVLLFDEATAVLDDKDTKDVEKIIKKLKTDHTILMTTQNLDLLRLADEIIILDGGKISARGNYQELHRLNML